MREMRLKQLTSWSSESAEKPTPEFPEFPRVCAVVMDWPVDAATITLIARSTGDASLYSTGSFGVIGGIGHETVRQVARSCVKAAEKHYTDANQRISISQNRPHSILSRLLQ